MTHPPVKSDTEPPKTPDELLQALKSILSHVIRKWSQIEEKLSDGFYIFTKAKVDYLKEYAATDQYYHEFRESHKHDRAGFDLIDRQLATMQKHSSMYMELMNLARKLQAKAMKFAQMEAKVMGGSRTRISTVDENIAWTKLKDEIYGMYADFVAEAVEKQGAMERDEEIEEEVWRDFDRRMAEDEQTAAKTNGRSEEREIID